MSTTHPSHLQISRRATFSGAALTAGLAATLSACRWGPPDEIAPDDVERDADDALLQDVRRQVAARGTLAERTAAAHVGLATALAPVIALHQAHTKVLGDGERPATQLTPSGQPDPAVQVVPPDANSALAQLRAQEAALQSELAAAATSAASGQLARTLASMAAGVAMHLTALPTPRTGASR